MRKLLVIGLAILFSTIGFSQSRKNFVYLCPFPYNASLGVDHAIQISPKKWSSGRFYFVASPNILWSGYGSNTIDPYMTSSFSQYEFVLPIHLRYELAPFRLMMGTKPGKHDNDVSVFFDIGVSLNYILSTNLTEKFRYRDPNTNFEYTFDGSITSSIGNPLSANYLTLNFGFRYNRYILALRHYEPFVDTQYKDLSKDWGKPAGVESFFYDRYTIASSYYKQGTTTLCLGYTF